MSAQNLWKWSLNYWNDSYTQHELRAEGLPVYSDDWNGWGKSQVHDMLEESSQFFMQWNFHWVSWY